MSFKNRVRLPILFYKPQFPMERNVFRKANGVTKVLSMVVRNTFEGKTDELPEDWHRKLTIALAHDTVTIENERLLSDVVLDGDYEIDWQDFLQYPVAQANFKVQVTPFNATNSNCQTCEEMTQLNLVDDSSDETWAEGTTHDFPDVLTDNDEICCNPYTISLVSYNTIYFQNVSIDPVTGILTATVNPMVPNVDQTRVATYQVTCADGSYDQANVYVNISGSGPATCQPPGGEGITHIIISGTVVRVYIDILTPPLPPTWNWELYETSDLGTIIQSGTVSYPTDMVEISGLTPGTDYTVVVVNDCGGGDFSSPVTTQFVTPNTPESVCGNFDVTYLPSDDLPPQNISYMDCAGDIQNETLTYGKVFARCMMLPSAGATTPLYFVASTDEITINYTGLC